MIAQKRERQVVSIWGRLWRAPEHEPLVLAFPGTNIGDCERHLRAFQRLLKVESEPSYPLQYVLTLSEKYTVTRL